jgi:uncharacterized phage protein gp47/JayE
MAFNLPTLTQLAERTYNALNANIKGADARLWPNNVAVSAKAMAGAVWEAFSFLEYISKQMLVHTATDPIWIQRHAAEFGMSQLPATYATGTVDITGDASITVPAGLILERADGVRYEIINSGTTDLSGDLNLPVRALEPGKLGNAIAGIQLTFVVPQDRIAPECEVAAGGIGAGADPESMESLRQRVLFRKRNPPHGGAAHDYVIWAREIGGVTRVFVDPVNIVNERITIGVWFLMDDTYVNGVPQAADVAAVQAYIDSVKPAGAVADVAAPTPVTVNVTIANLSPDTTAVRDAIQAELRALFRREVRVSTETEPFTLWRSLIIEAIANATGEHHHSITAPNSDVAYTAGQLPVLGTVTFS